MNAQEKIIEAFLRSNVSHTYKRSQFYHSSTNVNYVFSNGKEADLLAISTDGVDRIHIEVGVSVTHWPDDGFIPHLERKFFDKNMHEQVKDYFGGHDFRKAYVIFDTDYPNAQEQYIIDGSEIEIWSLASVIRAMTSQLDTSNYQDEILRTLQFVKYTFSLESAIRRKRRDTRVSSEDISKVSLEKMIEYTSDLILDEFDKDALKTIKSRHFPDGLL